jgi:integrase
MKRRMLPKYVTSFIDRHGTERLRYRRAGRTGGYFSAQLGTEAFREQYRAFEDGQIVAVAPRPTVVSGSIDDLLNRFYRSSDYLGNAQPHTLAKRRAVLEAFRNRRGTSGKTVGERQVSAYRFDTLDRIIAKVAQGEDGKGGPFAAQTLKKQLNRMFRYAVKLGWIAQNPMEYVSYRAPKTDGHHCWSEIEIEQYRAFHPLGTNPRLALELLLWTGKRKSDGIKLGRHNHRDGMMWGRDQKTGKEWWLPIAPQLAAAIAAMPAHDHLCYLVSARGRPYSAASFGNMMRSWCDQAGLPHCSAHGLRKAISRRMATIGINNAGGKSVTLHSGDAEYAHYTAAAAQKTLAVSAISNISAWEESNLADGLDNLNIESA